jgi:hypothetical protein
VSEATSRSDGPDPWTLDILERERASRLLKPRAPELAWAVHRARTCGWSAADLRDYVGGMADGTESDFNLIGRLIDRLPALVRQALMVSTVGFSDLQKLRQKSADDSAFALLVIAKLAERQRDRASGSVRYVDG